MDPIPITLPECFKETTERVQGDVLSNFCHKMADFVEVSSQTTVNRWLSGTNQPTGGNKWKTVVFFHLIGHNVREFGLLRPLYQEVVLMLALKAVTFDALVVAFGFEDNQDPASVLYRVFNTNGKILPARTASVEKFVQLHTDDLVAAKELFFEAYQDVMLARVLTDEPEVTDTTASSAAHSGRLQASVASLPAVPKKGQSAKLAILQSLAAMVQATLPLAKMVASDTFTREDRAALRELSGVDGVFKLSNLFEQLCGENARKQTGVKK